MYLKALYLCNFRLYKEKLYEFSPGVNIIRGVNGIGKTALLEAIYFLITGRSFRTSHMTDLIRHGANSFHVESVFNKQGLYQKIKVYYRPSERRVTYNSTVYPFLSSLLGHLQGIIIHPDDNAIIKGAPASRRLLLDTHLAQGDPLYIHHLTRYDRAMRQRNLLLKAKINVTIESWEYEMAHAAAYIVQQRESLTQSLTNEGKSLYKILSGGHEVFALNYKGNGLGEYFSKTKTPQLNELLEIFTSQYKRHRPREMALGSTMTGPHKDDVRVSLNEQEAKSFGSEGQQRSCVAALKLSEWATLKNSSQQQPLMLVDDIGLSLDGSRKKYLMDHLLSLNQVIITTTEE